MATWVKRGKERRDILGSVRTKWVIEALLEGNENSGLSGEHWVFGCLRWEVQLEHFLKWEFWRRGLQAVAPAQKCEFLGHTPDLGRQELGGWDPAICASFNPSGDSEECLISLHNTGGAEGLNLNFETNVFLTYFSALPEFPHWTQRR